MLESEKKLKTHDGEKGGNARESGKRGKAESVRKW